MKRLLLTLTITLLGFVSYSQKIFIESEYRQSYSKYGKYEDINIVLNSPDSIYERRLSATYYVIDLDKRTMLAEGFHEKILINDLQINKNDSIYVIDYVAEVLPQYQKIDDVKEFLPITIFLDVSKNTMGFLYYWEGSSWVQQRDDVIIQ